MHVVLLGLLVVVAGCIQASPRPMPGTATPERNVSDPKLGAESCPRIEIVQPSSPFRIADGPSSNITVRVTNCLDRAFSYHEPDCRGSIWSLTIEGNGLKLYNWGAGDTLDAPPERSDCTDSAPNSSLAPGEIIERPFWFAGGYSHCDQGACPFNQYWVTPGQYVVRALLTGDDGKTSQATMNLTILAPEVPKADPNADIVLNVNKTYHINETVNVTVTNHGNRTYSYGTYYTACGMGFYNATSYPFRIPPGTHCDLVNTSPLKPGETASLFLWHLDICTKDQWGCAESKPLAPGDYHVRLTLSEYHDPPMREPGYSTTTGWDFTIVP